MAVTVGQIMRMINNFFETGYRETDYAITGGALSPDDLLRPGMWIAITGSCFHDGVYQLGGGNVLTGAPAGAVDEEFHGRVWFLRPPSGFLELCKNIAEFDEKTPVGGYRSESFGSYSYTRQTAEDGSAIDWTGVYAGQLAPNRRMFSEVNV